MSRKRFLLAILLLLYTGTFLAQKLTINAPSQAEVGRQIRVSYILNNSDFDRIQLEGDFEGFELLYGPALSTSSSVSIINGHTTQSSSTTFTYTLTPKKAGTFTLPAASLNSGGKKVKSSTAKVEVLPSSGGASQSSGGNYGGYGGSSASSSAKQQNSNSLHDPSSGEHIGPKDLYFAVTTSKKRVFEQEAILLTYKLYSLVTVDQLAGEIPQLDGFHTQEIELPQQRSFTMERVGNKNYGTVVWRQYVLFPQKSGKLVIPAVDYEADVVTVDQSTDPFDAFFSGGSMSRRVKKIVRAPSVEIVVDPLPEKPANFSGAVGKGFSISGKLIPGKVEANDATTLSVTLKGVGNLKLINAPTVQWPADFEQYDPKTNQDVNLSTSGNSGTITYEYVAVPRHEGTYNISPVEFCYFDTESQQYRTIKTNPFTLEVAKGSGKSSASRQADLQEIGSDIRYIKSGSADVRKPGDDMFASLTHILCYVIPALLCLVVVLLLRKRSDAMGNVTLQRGRKAGKAAAKRLKVAAKLLNAGKADAFYDEVLHALWGYVSDKLNLPVQDLNKDNISDRLKEHGVDDASTQQFLSVLTSCEFARFAPGDPATNMEKLFDSATNAIDHLDEVIKK